MGVETKVCTRCKNEFPCTTEYFAQAKDCRNGLYPSCRECNRTRLREYQRQRYADPEFREHEKQRSKKYRAANNEKQHEYFRQRLAIPEVRERKRNYDRARWGSPEVKARSRENKRNNIQSTKAAYQRRRARKLGLADTFNATDWERATDYFGGCAVCGRQSGEQFTLAADHWIPLSSPDCPGTTPKNVLPLCHGLNGCNNSKSNRDAKEWLIEKFGEVEAVRILTRIEAYFASLENEG